MEFQPCPSDLDVRSSFLVLVELADSPLHPRFLVLEDGVSSCWVLVAVSHQFPGAV